MAKIIGIKSNKALKKLSSPRMLVFLIALILVVSMAIAAPKDKLIKESSPNKSTTQSLVTNKPTTATTKSASVPAPAPTTVTKPVVQSAPHTITSSAPVTPVATTAPTPGTGVSGLTPTPSGSNTSGSSTSDSGSSTGSKTGSNTGSNTSGSTSTISYESLNWAGYISASGNFSAVSSNWIATSPTGNNESITADATWIGIGGVTSDDLIQTGTYNTVTASGSIEPAAFYELLPDASEEIPSLIISPEDHMSASIIEQSSGVWDISLRDINSGQSFTTTVSYDSTNSSAEWIEEDPSYSNGHLVPFDNFGTAYFTNGLTSINSTSENIYLSGGSGVKMVNREGQTIAMPEALTNGNFSVSE